MQATKNNHFKGTQLETDHLFMQEDRIIVVFRIEKKKAGCHFFYVCLRHVAMCAFSEIARGDNLKGDN